MRVLASGRFKTPPAGSPLTPAAQIVTSEGIESPFLTMIDRGFNSATAVLSRTFTPSFSKSFFARADNFSENIGKIRGPASMRLIRICDAAWAWSFFSGPRTNSAKAPAISTPVGPPPTTEIEKLVSSSNRHKSSKRRITSARIDKASLTLFIPRACSATPGIPKSAVTEPSATIN